MVLAAPLFYDKTVPQRSYPCQAPAYDTAEATSAMGNSPPRVSASLQHLPVFSPEATSCSWNTGGVNSVLSSYSNEVTQKIFLRELHGELESVWVLLFTKSLFFLLHSDFSSLSPLVFFLLLHVCSFSSLPALRPPFHPPSVCRLLDTPWSWWLMTISE